MGDKIEQVKFKQESDCLEKMKSNDKGESFTQMDGKRKSQEMEEGRLKRMYGIFPPCHTFEFDTLPNEAIQPRGIGLMLFEPIFMASKLLENEEYKKSDGSNVPSYLDYVAAAYEEYKKKKSDGIGRDIAAYATFSDGILERAMYQYDYCNACICGEQLMGRLFEFGKSRVKTSDFKSFDKGWNKRDGVPLYLDYVHQGIGRDVTATTPHCDDLVVLPRAMFYAVIDEMHNMQLHGINEEILLKWRLVMRDARKMGLDVKFAEEHLKKIAHAYCKSTEPAGYEEDLRHDLKLAFCTMSESESFDDGVPLSEGILFPPMDGGANKKGSHIDSVSLRLAALDGDGANTTPSDGST